MIRYKSDLFGLRTLFIWNGSAAFRAVIPALISTGLVVVYDTIWGDQVKNMVEETYAIMVMISFFGFLLTTRLNFSYTRWWEAVTMCHEMTSKLADSAACLAANHYQSKIWDPIRPQSFGEVYASKKKVEGNSTPSICKKRGVIQESQSLTVSSTSSAPSTFPEGPVKKDRGFFLQWVQEIFTPPTVEVQSTDDSSSKPRRHRRVRSLSAPMLSTKSFHPNEGSERLSLSCSQPSAADFAPSDFLEEMVHLFSLLNAVAMASLRHDVEGCPSPLAEYIPNQPFPPYNSDDSNFLQTTHEDEEPNTTTPPHSERWENKVDQCSNFFQFLAGIKRSPKQRTLYNAERPFHVLGGVSEAEAKRLQLARGHNAQVALCQIWLKEFIVREHLDGSTGKVDPPIISRISAYLSEASVAYHQCSKIAFVPFPFPHEQMTSLFTWMVVISYPVLPVAFVHDLALACVLNFATILCFQGIYEVARELTNPYHTVPNDLPLNRFHAEFNETLRSLLMGYHPDSTQKDSHDHFG